MVLTSIDNKYRIRVLDPMNIVVEKYGYTQTGKTPGREYVTSAYYFRTLEQAFDHLLDRGIAHHFEQAEQLEDLVGKIEELKCLLETFAERFPTAMEVLNGKSVS